MKIDAFLEQLTVRVKSWVSREVGRVDERVNGLEARIKDIPAGPPGKDGAPGEAGKDADLEAVAAMIDERVEREIEKRIAALPKPRDGVDGKDVHPDTIALMVREAADKLVGNLPKPKDGRDGFGLEDFELELDEDGRTLVLKFVRGEEALERRVRVPFPMDCGVYRPETKYQKGDGVTFGGSWWLAQVDEPQGKPDAGTGEWRLAVKRGRDGRDVVAK